MSFLKRLIDGRVRGFLRDSSWMLGATVFSSAVQMAQVVIVTRLLGAERYGKLVLVMVVATSVRQFLGVRIWEWAMKEFAVAYTKRDAAHGAQVMRSGYLVGFVVNALSFVIVLAGSRFAAIRVVHDVDTWFLVAAYGLVLLVNWSYDLSFAVLRVSGRFRYLAIQQAGSSLLRLVVIGGAVLAWRSLGTTVAAYVVVEVATSLWLLLAAGQAFNDELGQRWWRVKSAVQVLNRGDMRKLMAIGSLIDTLKLLGTRLDFLVLGWYQSPIVVANYQAALNFIDAITKLSQPATMVVFSDLAKLGARGEGRQMTSLVSKLSILAVVVVLPAAALLCFTAPLLCRLAYGAGYPTAPGLLQIQAWTILWLAAMWMLPTFVSVGKAQWGLQFFIVVTALKLGLLFTLTPLWGATGLAWANLAYCLAMPALMPLYLVRLRRWVTSAEYAARPAAVAGPDTT